MTDDFKVILNNYKPLEAGSYEATLERVEKRDTKHGEDRLMWRFWVPEHNTEVVGWSSSSPSPRAKSYAWARSLNPDVASQGYWGPADVVGKGCVLVVEIVEGEDGRTKNKILKVNPYR